MKLLLDRVAVIPFETEEISPGGIIIPDTAKEKSYLGKVIAVGEGKITDTGKRIPMHVHLEDTVLFGKYAGTETKIEGVDVLIINEDSIFAIM